LKNKQKTKMITLLNNKQMKEYFKMKLMNRFMFSIAVFSSLVLFANVSKADWDLSPSLVNGKLILGGIDCEDESNTLAGPISVFGFDFGEDSKTPYNTDDPGVCQSAGVGNLIAGAKLDYSVLSSLYYWNGAGDVSFTPATTQYLTMDAGHNKIATLTGTSGSLPDSYYIQCVEEDGHVHTHLHTSIFADTEHSNKPSEPNYQAPADGIYAFQMSLTMTDTDNGKSYTSDPVWIVWNNNMEDKMDAAMAAVPEPVTLALFVMGGMAMLRRNIA
jgi:hypothetical protein